ncbi:MarR family winged helix-turn-helix transcriptional regulator [Falsirhodobacter sp. 1013]|uniref:MarR family winged helix-turn-helix transcriptional regulator n=1 Tax=Falsirhodobacter sp. 1013 TaxID=3417566 RepID=UPI003EBA8C82
MDTDLAHQRLRLWLQMLKSVRHVETDLRERLRVTHAMTLPRFDVMAMLDRMPEGVNMSRLSEGLMISNGNVTGIVARLVADGLVERVAVEGDRRAMSARLTPQGKALMARMAEDHLAWINEIMGPLDEADTARAIALMIDLRQRS